MIKEEALKIVDELVQSPNIKKHCLAAAAAMGGLYDSLKEKGEDIGNRDDWEVVGLFHDADYDALKRDVIASGNPSDNYEVAIMEKHTDIVVEKVKDKVSQDVIDAIRGHADKAERKTLMAKAIFAADELTGLIVAAALVRPDPPAGEAGKKLEGLTAESVLKRLKEPAFARAVSREDIKSCETELNIPLADFVGIVLNSMKGVSKDLGL